MERFHMSLFPDEKKQNTDFPLNTIIYCMRKRNVFILYIYDFLSMLLQGKKEGRGSAYDIHKQEK